MNDSQDRFWRLLEPEYTRAMMYCRKLAGGRDSGDDLFQDALLKACRKFEDLRDQGAFKAWLYRLIINTFTSTVRRPWWKRRLDLTEAHERLLVERDPTEAHQARRWLQVAFRSVSAEDQALVTLYELEGWPMNEIAELHGKSVGAVKVRIFRARHKMKETLEKYLRAEGTAKVVRTNEEEVKACAVPKSSAE